jgi:3-deoxy-D-manno-octulosonate 8-phosphate phosphatase (KDO 8-P phosphatase)
MQSMDKHIKEKVSKIKMLISDVDGVLTDGTIYKSSTGDELKKFNVTDGSGIAMARAINLKLAWISGRYSKTTTLRANELNIEDLYNGTLDKIEPYTKIKHKHKLKDDEIAYLGDDIIDLPVMEIVGVPIAVANAVDIIKDVAIHITAKNGGEGAFREAIDWIITVQGRYDEALQTVKTKIFRNKK